MLDERKAAILAALVEEHIRSGEPVSSHAILDHSRLQCSTATIRNELVILEHEGYIVKPHTSAGRVPTDRGYRYYIDHISPGSLRRTSHMRVEQFFASMHSELDRMLKQTSELLADVARYPSVVIGPGVGGQTVSDVHLLPVGPENVLLVLVTERGRVTQSLLRLGVPVAPAQVAHAQQALAEMVDGRALEGSGPVVPEEEAAAVARAAGKGAKVVGRATKGDSIKVPELGLKYSKY